MKLQKKSLVMAKLNDLIRVYDNSISSKTCDNLISYFESNPDKHEILKNNGNPNFTQLNLTRNREDNKILHNSLIQCVFKYRNEYYKHVHREVFPDEHAFEEFRIKRYNTGGEDRFDTHVDVYDYSTSRRFLSFFWYLNDVEEGGETEFDDSIIKPKKGTLIVFPPLWMFPHRGKPPISESKYLLSTYLHYK